jgi:hypothetical protein
MALLLRHRMKRVGPELVRPLPRPGSERSFRDHPHERAVLATAFAIGTVLVAGDPGAGAARLAGLAVVAGGIVFIAGRYFLKFERDAVSSLRRVAALCLLSLLLLFLARMARDTERFSLLLLPVPTLTVLLALLLSPRFAIAFAGLLLALVALVAWDARELRPALLTLGAGSFAGALY